MFIPLHVRHLGRGKNQLTKKTTKYFYTQLGFPNGVDWWGGQFGQNSQKLHENDKIGILGSKQWGGCSCLFRSWHILFLFILVFMETNIICVKRKYNSFLRHFIRNNFNQNSATFISFTTVATKDSKKRKE